MKYRFDDQNYTAVHCIGNGRVCAYEKGPDIFQLFGPSYSAPNIGSITLCRDSADFFALCRQPQTDIWTHTLYQGETFAGTIKDSVLENRAVFVRQVAATKEMTMQLECTNLKGLFKLPENILPGQCYMGEIPEGTAFYSHGTNHGVTRGYFSDRCYYVGILVNGDGRLSLENPQRLSITVCTGDVIVAFSADYRALVREMADLLAADITQLVGARAAAWESRAARANSRLPKAAKQYAAIIDDVAVLIQTQQSVSGGILAGHHYHLVYIRDNYSVSRALLEMGYYEEACRLLLFYAGVFAKYGEIHNAQVTDGFGFHVHENDAAEITGYMILMATDYYDKTKDLDTLKKTVPLLRWCVQQQHDILYQGMLPFNGDETYIAGGILPRSAINHGSMEATALYHTACVRLLAYAKKLDFEEDFTNLLKGDIMEIAKNFNSHFMINGRLACDNPAYQEKGAPIRIGVSFCGHGIALCVRNRFNDYVCTQCLEKCDKPIFHDDNDFHFTPSALLMPLFVGSGLIDPAVAGKQVESIADQLLANEPGVTITGYDYGLMAYALHGKDEEKRKVFIDKILALRDNTGAWVEYYRDGIPKGCMCRPWESAINVLGLLKGLS